MSEPLNEVPEGTAIFPLIPAELGIHPLLLCVLHAVVFFDGSSEDVVNDAAADEALQYLAGYLQRLGGAGKAYLLGDYANATAEESELRDPYGGDVEGYRQTLQQLERLLFSARERLLTETPR